MVLYLTFLAILSLIFLIMLFVNYRRTKINGRPEHLAAVRIAVSWILLITLVSSGGGAVYAAMHHNKKANAPKTEKVTKKAARLDALNVEFTPQKPALKDGKVKVKFKVSEKTKVKIVQLDGKKTVKTFDNANKKADAQFEYIFKKDGKYNVIATRNGQKMVHHLTIKAQKKDEKKSSSSSSESEGSSSNSSSSSSTTGSTKSKSNGNQSTGSTYNGRYVPSGGYGSGSTGGSAGSGNDGGGTGTAPATSDNTAPAASDSGVTEEYVPSGN
ncbi:hypothetical protein [Paucilactobacillus sp. N302-9]